MKKKKVYLADLTHTGNGIAALTFPLGTAYVASYAQMMLGDDFEFKLFKFPEQLAKTMIDDPPYLLACSNYSWNLELTHKLHAWAKRRNPKLVSVLGGPNFPVEAQEKSEFLKTRSEIDFYIENEGEVGFVELLIRLRYYDLDASKLKNHGDTITNCSYLAGESLISGDVRRISDINIIPSPYLNGIMDEFFEYPLTPMLETTRGCPFRCSFCADGLESKNKVERYDDGRFKDELDYIRQHVRNIDEIVITDLNFGMYPKDVETAQIIATMQTKYRWPSLIRGSAGKNEPERIIKTASILKGSWAIGSAIQSSDKEVLANIRRSNISSAAYKEFLHYANSVDKDSLTYTEIILALPGDSKEKHFASLRYGIENKVNTVRMYQAIVLTGTEMATQKTRDRFELLTKFRIIPGGVGTYQFGEDRISVAEMEEIIVGSKDLSFEDYVSCRVMNLFIEGYLNNALCYELFAALRAMDVSTFDLLAYLHQHQELYSQTLNDILARFIEATRNDLFNSREEAEESVLSSDHFAEYLSGKLGSNELLDHKALIYLNLEDSLGVLLRAAKSYLHELGLLGDTVREYLEQTCQFILCRKMDILKLGPGMERRFNFDFEDIAAQEFDVDPRTVQMMDQPIHLKFYNDELQIEQIRNAVNLYRNHPGGISRVLQRFNLKSVSRHFERV